MDKTYIKKKIENCQGLVDNATSEAQEKVYQGYLEFWQSKLKPKPKPIVVEPPEREVVPEKEVIEEPQRTAEEESIKAEEFETIYPNKRAYLRRNGELLKTKAFKEFLISKE